jgi:DNA mismatch repair protein MSH6
MAKLPDLKRLVSRIHAGSCKPNELARALEGFEQVEHTTMSLLQLLRDDESNDGDGIFGRFLASMPDLGESLHYLLEGCLRPRQSVARRSVLP